MPDKVYRIRGAGIAGRVLHHELNSRDIPSVIEDIRSFPRNKVCGGVLQQSTWNYLKNAFSLSITPPEFSSIQHYRNSRPLYVQHLKNPMVYVDRFDLDPLLKSADADKKIEKNRDTVNINASGVPKISGGSWVGFSSESEPVPTLQMHYGNSCYAGLCPSGSESSHLAFVVNRAALKKNPADRILKSELGIKNLSPLKGTPSINYSYYSPGLSVGDSKMPTHPLFGFGMKHAVESSKLMAECIQKGKILSYDRLHKERFASIRRINRVTDFFYRNTGSIVTAFLKVPAFSRYLYHQFHG